MQRTRLVLATTAAMLLTASAAFAESSPGNIPDRSAR
jgi:hypothetical protein